MIRAGAYNSIQFVCRHRVRPRWNAAVVLMTRNNHLGDADESSRRSNYQSNPGLQRRLISSLSKEAATAPVDYDPAKRWLAVPPANAVHISIGSVYVYSMWTPGLTHALGVVSSAPMDWTHAQVLPVFSTTAVGFGLTTGLLGSWVEKVGPRKAGFIGSVCWSSALLTAAAGVHYHSLPLIYLGWGVIGGVGWGLMYLSPVTAVMKWFPDRRGLATGIGLSAFGAGAAIAPAVIHSFLEMFAVAPDFVGPLATSANVTTSLAETAASLTDAATSMTDASSTFDATSQQNHVTLTTLDDGTQVVAENSALGTPGQHVVVATEADLAHFPKSIETGPGVYALGTGDSGTSKGLAALGVTYGALGMLGSRCMMLPHSDWTPQRTISKEAKSTPTGASEGGGHHSGNASEEATVTAPQKESANDIGLPLSYVMNTMQFPLLWLAVFGNATGGLALLSSSKLMITDIWAGAAPSIVTTSFATKYVSALGLGNAVGRFGWSALSDYLGRRNTYALFGLGVPIVGLAPALCHAGAMSQYSHVSDGAFGVLPLFMTFCGGSILAITFYGGLFSILPAYIADLFGQKHAGAIHGKLLTALASSAVVGPMGLAFMRSQSVETKTKDLIGLIEDSNTFQQAFGCSLDDAAAIQTLIDAKTITIARLMEIAPPGTVDPTPFLYDTTCYAAAALMTVSAFANLSIRPINVEKTFKELQTKEQKTNMRSEHV